MTFYYTDKVEVSKSTAISAVAHNNQDNTMFVRFTHGNEVVYKDVVESTYRLFVSADSLGKFFNDYIHDQYQFSPKHVFGNKFNETELVSAYDADPAPEFARGGFISTTDANDYRIGDPYVVPTGPNPFAPPVPMPTVPAPWEVFTTETADTITVKAPEPPVSKYRVHWESDNGTTGGESPKFFATSEQEAIETYFEHVEAAKKIDDEFARKYANIRVTAVTHYID